MEAGFLILTTWGAKYDLLFIFQNRINNFNDILGHKQDFLDTKQSLMFLSYKFFHGVYSSGILKSDVSLS